MTVVCAVGLTVMADRGDFAGEQLRARDEASITTFVPKQLRSGSKTKDRFGKQAYVNHSDEDVYRCPADEKLTRHFSMAEHCRMLHRYWIAVCADCPLKEPCTTAPRRRISRWEHEALLEGTQRRLDLDAEKMKVRRRTAEHLFGTLKSWMGAINCPSNGLKPPALSRSALAMLVSLPNREVRQRLYDFAIRERDEHAVFQSCAYAILPSLPRCLGDQIQVQSAAGRDA